MKKEKKAEMAAKKAAPAPKREMQKVVMKVNVKHNGVDYKQGKEYDLLPELHEMFAKKAFI